MASSAYKYSVYSILLFVIFALNNLATADDAVNPTLPRTCFSCEGINCLRITKLNATMECADLMDYCVTVFKGFTVVARGCYGELESSYREKCDLAEHPECAKCYGNRCNDKGRADFKCIECKSSENSKCATDTSNLAAVQCPIPTAQNSYCYVRHTSDGGTTRGCFVHMQEQRECLNDSQCSMCMSDAAEACNTYKVTAEAESAGISGRMSNVYIVAIVAFTLLVFTV